MVDTRAKKVDRLINQMEEGGSQLEWRPLLEDALDTAQIVTNVNDYGSLEAAVAAIGATVMRSIEVGVQPYKDGIKGGDIKGSVGIMLHNQKDWGGIANYAAGIALHIYGETQMCVCFPTGAVQIIATEP